MSGEKTKQRPGLYVSGPWRARQRRLIGLCSADLELLAGIWLLVVEGMIKTWVSGSSEWPSAQAVRL